MSLPLLFRIPAMIWQFCVRLYEWHQRNRVALDARVSDQWLAELRRSSEEEP